MSKIRIVSMPDKSIAIIYPAPKSRRVDETKEQWLNRVFAKANPENLPYKDIDSSELPQSREYRDSWEWDNETQKIKVNLIKAEQIKREKLINEKMSQIEKQNKKEQAIAELIKEGKL